MSSVVRQQGKSSPEDEVQEAYVACGPSQPQRPRLCALPGASPRSVERAGCRLSRQIASAVFAVPLEEIARANRGEAEICTARHVAMYLAHVVFQVPLTGIGLDFGRDRTSVAHAVRRVEDQRDHPDFDARLTRLEALAGECRALLERPQGSA